MKAITKNEIYKDNLRQLNIEFTYYVKNNNLSMAQEIMCEIVRIKQLIK